MHCNGKDSKPLHWFGIFSIEHPSPGSGGSTLLALDERPAHPESPDLPLVVKLSASQPGVSASSSHSACPSSMRRGQGLDRTAAASTVASPASPAWDRHTLLQQPTILVAKDCKHTKTHKNRGRASNQTRVCCFVCSLPSAIVCCGQNISCCRIPTGFHIRLNPYITQTHRAPYNRMQTYISRPTRATYNSQT